jgi:methyltransferase family protein
MTFEEAMNLTRTVNCSGVYSDEALKALWYAATQCPAIGNFVEIGSELGRSASLLAQASKARGNYLVLIDPFVKHLDGTPGSSVAASLVGVLVGIDVEFCLLRGPSHRVPYNFGPISLLHIDGNHSEAFLLSDLERFFPLVMEGGYICFHDYGNQEPYSQDVKATIDKNANLWETVGVFDTCMVVQKKGPYKMYYCPWGGRP